jgi:hypothetical protein
VSWIDDFIEWCRNARQANLEQAERYESGQQRLLHNDVDVSEEAANRHRRIVADMTNLIARAERNLDV